MTISRYPTFRHGIHPEPHKDDTAHLPIRQFPFAPVMALPLSQHKGSPPEPIVREGQQVRRGQLIAEPVDDTSVGLHSPATGIIQRLGPMPSISGSMVEGFYLTTTPGSTQEVDEGRPCDISIATGDEIIDAIQRAGIVGLGGAAFPTHLKLKTRDNLPIESLILNGAECEPYLTTDHRVMLEHPDDVMLGLRYLQRATNAARVFIGLEDNKSDAASALDSHTPDDLEVTIGLVPVKYPQGAEKMLVKSLLDREIPVGGLPLDVGAVVINVSTAAEIGRLLPHGWGIHERVITISGPAITRKGNYRIPLGTPLRYALEQAGVTSEVSQVMLGGPMMGMALPSLDIPITKGISGFVAFTRNETGRTSREYPCINCGYCVDACPLLLNPRQLGMLAKQADYKQMAERYDLMTCFECGTCTYVCPAHIPLVQRFRAAKSWLSKPGTTTQ